MPDIKAQFSEEVDIVCRHIESLDNTVIFLLQDMAKIATGEIKPQDIRKFAVQSLIGANNLLDLN